jgi:hypothetical protein
MTSRLTSSCSFLIVHFNSITHIWLVRLLKQKWHNTNSVEITSSPKFATDAKNSSPWLYARYFRRGSKKLSQKQQTPQQQSSSRFASNFYIKGCLTFLGSENTVTGAVPPITVSDNGQKAAPSTSNDSGSRTSSSPLVLLASGAFRSFKSSCTTGADTESLEHNNSFVYETECGPISPPQQHQQLTPRRESCKKNANEQQTSLQVINNENKPSFSFYSSHLTNSIKSKFNSFKLSYLTYKGSH